MSVALALPASATRRVGAQLKLELALTLRRGESMLLTFLIPVIILVFFSAVDILPTGTADPVDFLLPGVLALAVMSTAMTGVAIATGFERSEGVLKRLAATPLSRGDLIGAKVAAVLVIEVLQVVVLASIGLALGWRPVGDSWEIIPAMALATAGFAGFGLLMAGTLKALTTLAAANLVHLLLLLIGGVVVPLSDLPTPVRLVARALPIGALSDIAHASLGGATPVGFGPWLVLLGWAVAAPTLAAYIFRWT